MPSTAFDRTSRVVAFLLLLVSLWTSSHRQQDDDACLPLMAGEHDPSKHAFAPLAPAGDEHCAVCHWMRALKPTLADRSVASTALAPIDRLAAPAIFRHAAPASGRLPARAPPTPVL